MNVNQFNVISSYVFIVFIAILSFFYIGEGSLYFLFYFCIADLILIKFRFYRSDKERSIFFISYIFLNLLAIILIFHHLNYYDVPFDAYGDDKRFFDWGIDAKDNLLVSSYSIYEKIIAIIFLFYDFFNIENSIYQVLPFNVIFGAITVLLSYRISFIVTGKDLSISIIFFTVLLNYTYSQNVVHLYRDVYVAFFSIIFLQDLIEKRKRALLWVFLVTPFRFPNGIILLFLYVVSFTFSLNKGKLLKLVVLVILSSSLLVFMIGTNSAISKYNLGNIDSIVGDRITKFSAESSEVGGGMSVVNNMPFPIRFIVNNYVQVIRPVTINSFYHPVRESLKYEVILNHRSIGWAITTLSLIFLIGPYFNGVTNVILFKQGLNKEFCLYFIVMAFCIGFLSFLDRHRVLLIPLFPTLYAIGYYYVDSFFFKFKKNQAFLFLSLLFGSVIFLGVVK